MLSEDGLNLLLQRLERNAALLHGAEEEKRRLRSANDALLHGAEEEKRRLRSANDALRRDNEERRIATRSAEDRVSLWIAYAEALERLINEKLTSPATAKRKKAVLAQRPDTVDEDIPF